MFFDSLESSFSGDGSLKALEGDVVVVLAGMILVADRINFDSLEKTIEAQGNVMLVTPAQLIGGDELRYELRNKDFIIKNAFLIANDASKTDSAVKSILGVSPRELYLEAEKTQRLAELDRRTAKLKEEFLRSSRDYDATVGRLALLLEQRDMTAEQENPHLASLGKTRRERIRNRRAFWQNGNFSKAQGLGGNFAGGGYVKLGGASISRKANEYRAEKASLSPCRCDDDETAAWELNAHSLTAFSEGYADIYGSVVKIKGIPVFYLPFIKIPIKSQRQSGFLMPNFSYNRLNGLVVSQPVFLALGPDRDLTANFDLIDRRGLRVGVEGRYRPKTFSGWTIRTEAVRDRLWLEQRGERFELLDVYRDGLARATAKALDDEMPAKPSANITSDLLSEPGYWSGLGLDDCLVAENLSACQQRTRAQMAPANNRWRHLVRWQGQQQINPQVSFVSEGNSLSDHRYMQDLYFERFNESYNPDQPALYSPVRAHLHVNTSPVYLGIGSTWGDPMRTRRRYSGHQLPLIVKAKTRMFSVFEGPAPLYWNVNLVHRKILLIDDDSMGSGTEAKNLQTRLNSGSWSQLKGNWMMPLTPDMVFNLGLFGDVELRAIRNRTEFLTSNNDFSPVDVGAIASEYSDIETFKVSLALSLPIDGVWQLDGSEFRVDELQRYLNHRMSWDVTLTLRPSVVRRGNYGELFNAYKLDETLDEWEPIDKAIPLTYYESDSSEAYNHEFLLEEERMRDLQQITFSTSHDWYLVNRRWSKVRAQEAPSQPKVFGERNARYYRQLATNELEQIDQEARAIAQIADEEAAKNRGYAANTEQEHLLNVTAQLSFDFRKEREREDMRSDASVPESRLPQPWSPVRGAFKYQQWGWSLDGSGRYNIYERLLNQASIHLAPPKLLATQLKFGLAIDRESAVAKDGGIEISRTVTRDYTVASALAKPLSVFGRYGVRNNPSSEPAIEQYASAGLSYASRSGCWGLKFYWRKDFPDPSWEGSYFLSLNVLFFNSQREYGNLLSRVNKIKRRRTENQQ